MSKAEFSIKVQVQPLPEQTDATQGVYAFAYTVTIVNSGDTAAQLVARHWHISDAQGQAQEVRGLAVVGHQPLLQPGDTFQYSSWAQIGTPQGSMRGRFLCITEAADVFHAEVPEFLLAEAGSLH